MSACLLGEPCRYDGGSKPVEAVAAAVAAWPGAVRAVCPEASLGTPRPAAELRGGDGHAVLQGEARVCRRGDGSDLTEAFVAGARAAAGAAAVGEGGTEKDTEKDTEEDTAILKARSPSCGVGRTWIDGQISDGDGVFAALLRGRGVALRTDEDLSGPR